VQGVLSGRYTITIRSAEAPLPAARAIS
jgi:hypothetical protein